MRGIRRRRIRILRRVRLDLGGGDCFHRLVLIRIVLYSSNEIVFIKYAASVEWMGWGMDGVLQLACFFLD